MFSIVLVTFLLIENIIESGMLNQNWDSFLDILKIAKLTEYSTIVMKIIKVVVNDSKHTNIRTDDEDDKAPTVTVVPNTDAPKAILRQIVLP